MLESPGNRGYSWRAIVDLRMSVMVKPQGKPTMTTRSKYKHTGRWKVDEDGDVVDVSWFGYCNTLLQAAGWAHKRKTAQKAKITALFKAKTPDLWDKPHRKKPDASNILKGVEDALLSNDESISDTSCRKAWSDHNELLIELEGIDE